MRGKSRLSALLLPVVLSVAGATAGEAKEEKQAAKMEAAGPDWALKATIIEACSCPMFCQCYFNTKPAGHSHEGHGNGSEHFCRFNNAFRVTSGHYGKVPLDGAKFWVAGDLGGDFSQGKMDWAVVTFDEATSEPQRAAIAAIAAHLYPVQWNSLTTSVGKIEWKAEKDSIDLDARRKSR